jgi:hypothetical protein
MTPQRLAYTGFMVLSLVVFIVAYRLMPKPAGVAALPRWKRWILGLAGFVGGSLGAVHAEAHSKSSLMTKHEKVTSE